MQVSSEPCGENCFGACEQKEKPHDYNRRVEEAIESLNSLPSFAIVDKGINGDDQSCILVLNGKLYGMGYIPAEAQVMETETLKEYIQSYKENSFIRNLVNGYAARYPSKLIKLNNSVTDQAIENFHQQAFD